MVNVLSVEALAIGDMSVCTSEPLSSLCSPYIYVPEEFLHLMFLGVVGDLIGDVSGSASLIWF